MVKYLIIKKKKTGDKDSEKCGLLLYNKDISKKWALNPNSERSSPRPFGYIFVYAEQL